jgi:ATP-dependent helicase/nuclease subunit A
VADLFEMKTAVIEQSQPPDQCERDLALGIRRSWIVEAPAGSGKTGLLIQRYLKLLVEESVVEPEQVLAITFTTKATAEMRERVLGELEAAQLGRSLKRGDAFERETRSLAEAVLQRDAARGWGLVDRPQRLNMRTIDSVCAWVAGSLPVLSGSGGGQSPVTEADSLYRAAAQRTLMQLGGSDEALHLALRTVLLHRDGNLAECETLLAQMLALRDQWGRLVPLAKQELDDEYLDGTVRPRLERALELAVCEGLTRLSKSMPSDVLSDLAILAGEMGHADGYKGEPSPIAVCAGLHAAPGETAEHLEHWRALIHLIVTADNKWRSGFRSNWLKFELDKKHATRLQTLVQELQGREALLDAIKRVDSLPPAKYPDDQWEVAKALFRVLRRALVELKLVFAERGECDFAEVGLQAKDALEAENGVSDLAVALGTSLRHLLVDEMQDTSTSQYGLIELLTQGWDGQSQTVFLVGDPKQSIYLFRQARVERFVRTMETLRLGDLPVGLLRLTANFRSQSGLVHAFNDDFELLFPRVTDATNPEDVPYVKAVAVRGARTGQSAVWHCNALPQGLKGDDLATGKRWQRQLEAENVRTIVTNWRARPLPEGRSDPWKIAVLVRGRNHLIDIVAEFKRDDGTGPIPFRAVKIDALGERQEVLDLTALTRALLHPADRIAWLAVLHAPWCGLGLADLHVLTGADDPAFEKRCVEDLIVERGHLLSDDGCERLTRLWPVMQAASNQRGRLTAAQWVERTWRTLGGDAPLTTEEIANTRRYLQLLDEIEAEAGVIDLHTLQERLGSLYAEAAAVPGAVDLMTIHGAKGLEWDVVLVPAMERQAQTSRGRLLTWDEIDLHDEDAAQVVLAPIAGKGEANHELNVWLNGIHKSREAAERRRLFYVVCTRAREELHLFASPETSTSGEIKLASGSLLQAAWPAAEAHFTVAATDAKVFAMPPLVDENPLAIAAGAEPEKIPPPRLKRLPLSFDPSARFTDALQLGYDGGDDSRAAHFERPEGSLAARSFGNAVHAFLDALTSRMAQGATAVSLLAELPQWKARIEAVLRGDGLPPVLVKREAQRALSALENTLKDRDGVWLLSAHSGGASEYALTAWRENRRSVRLDRVFSAGVQPGTDGTGCLWIVDYKTTEPGVRDVETFLANEKEKYRAQLEAYARVMHIEAAPEKLRVALYYPMLPRLVWWEPELTS